MHDSRVTDFPTERVKLMPEYSCDMPVRCDAGSWEDLNLPTDLVTRLAAWQAQFDANFRWDGGWLNADVRESWTRESEVLVADLQKQPRGGDHARSQPLADRAGATMVEILGREGHVASADLPLGTAGLGLVKRPLSNGRTKLLAVQFMSLP